jgi:hypothetical protein
MAIFPHLTLNIWICGFVICANRGVTAEQIVASLKRGETVSLNNVTSLKLKRQILDEAEKCNDTDVLTYAVMVIRVSFTFYLFIIDLS